MWTEVNHVSGNPTAGAGFGIAALAGLDAAYPELDLASRLTPEGRTAVERAKESCYAEYVAGFGTTAISDITDPNVLADRAWRRAYDRSLLGTRAPGAPAYVYHTTSDTIVPFAMGQLLYSSWCERGADVTFEKVVGLEHVAGAALGTPAGIRWLTDRLDGEPAAGGCHGQL